MTFRRNQMKRLLPWLLIIAVLAIGPLLASCAPSQSAATPTPTKTPRPEATNAPASAESPVVVEPASSQPNPTETSQAAASETVPAESPSPAPEPSATPVPIEPGELMSSPDFGVQAFLWWRPEVADRDLGLIKDAGFHWVKQLFSWQDIEGAGKGQYDWTYTDRLVDQVEKYGLKLIVRVSQDPDRPFWAGNPPDNAGDFAEFLTAIATRYKGRIHAYQVWNEPNLAREWGQKRPDPAGYVQILKKAYGAIKDADPNALVVTAGMAPTGTDNNEAMPDMEFYEQMYEAMKGDSDGYFDMLGAHAAGFAAAPEISPDETAATEVPYGGERFFAFRHLEDVRGIMERYGDQDKRIVVLEFGWTTDDRPDSPYYWHGAGAGIDESVKGDYLKRAYEWAIENWQPWIALMTVIYMPDVSWTKDTEQYYWSIIGPGYPDLFLRPAYVILCAYLNGLNGEKCKYDPGP